MEDFQRRELLPVSEKELPSIGLVELQPGVDTEPIAINLTDAYLTDDLVHEALLYCWGDANVKVPISLTGAAFGVTGEPVRCF